MSDIAEALRTAKVVSLADKHTAKNRARRIFWSIFAVLALSATAIVWYVRFSGDEELVPPKLSVPALPDRRPTPAGPRQETPARSVTPGAPATPANPSTPITAPSRAVDAAVTAAVQSLRVSAVTPGANPKALINGRMYSAEDEVVDGVFFVGVEGGELIFRDRAGTTYRRRF